MSSSKVIKFVCIDCGSEFFISVQKLEKRKNRIGEHICRNCYKKYRIYIKRGKIKTPQKSVRSFERGLKILKPTSIRKVWAKCEVCEKSFRQQYKYIFELRLRYDDRIPYKEQIDLHQYKSLSCKAHILIHKYLL